MGMINCGHGHFFNDDEHTSCPFCGVHVTVGGSDGAEKRGTRKLGDQSTGPEPDHKNASRTRRADSTSPRPDPGDGRTRAYWGGQTQDIDPVVGWLVCITGPDRGRDYRIRNGRNFVGRDPGMDIAITGDDTISRRNHAEIVYDPMSRGFFIAPGDSRGLVYQNKAPVLSPNPLQDRDLIQLGKTELMFVPLCGDGFNWEQEAEG